MANRDFDAELDVAVDAARRAGRIQMERYERLERIVHKSEHDVVTEVDDLSEELIIAAVRRAFPTDEFLAEESGRSGGKPSGSSHGTSSPPDGAASTPAPSAADRLWIIDPLDGTVNYANGIPVFCVSIGLAVDGRPVVGVVHDPTRDEMFTAIAGRGAWLDGAPIHHPLKPRLADAVVSLSLPSVRFARREHRIHTSIRVSRNMGSAALQLAYVANGRFDAMVQYGGLSLWDVTAAGLIAQEAGAMVTGITGGPWFDMVGKSRAMGIVAGSPAHHATLMEMLR